MSLYHHHNRVSPQRDFSDENAASFIEHFCEDRNSPNISVRRFPPICTSARLTTSHIFSHYIQRLNIFNLLAPPPPNLRWCWFFTTHYPLLIHNCQVTSPSLFVNTMKSMELKTMLGFTVLEEALSLETAAAAPGHECGFGTDPVSRPFKLLLGVEALEAALPLETTAAGPGNECGFGTDPLSRAFKVLLGVEPSGERVVSVGAGDDISNFGLTAPSLELKDARGIHDPLTGTEQCVTEQLAPLATSVGGDVPCLALSMEGDAPFFMPTTADDVTGGGGGGGDGSGGGGGTACANVRPPPGFEDSSPSEAYDNYFLSPSGKPFSFSKDVMWSVSEESSGPAVPAADEAAAYTPSGAYDGSAASPPWSGGSSTGMASSGVDERSPYSEPSASPSVDGGCYGAIASIAQMDPAIVQVGTLLGQGGFAAVYRVVVADRDLREAVHDYTGGEGLVVKMAPEVSSPVYLFQDGSIALGCTRVFCPSLYNMCVLQYTRVGDLVIFAVSSLLCRGLSSKYVPVDECLCRVSVTERR